MTEQQIRTTTIIRYDLIDRLKILFGKRPKVEVVLNILVEKEVENHNATAMVSFDKGSKLKFEQELPNYGHTAPVE